jgi:hypothetical protein
MRFMMVLKADATTESGALPDESLLTEMNTYNEELVSAGALLAGEGLHPTSAGARIRFSNGEADATLGPFAVEEGLIAGFWLIKVASLDEAIEWAKRAPLGGGAEIELRRVFEAEDFGDEFTLELRQAEDRLVEQMAANAKR